MFQNVTLKATVIITGNTFFTILSSALFRCDGHRDIEVLKKSGLFSISSSLPVSFLVSSHLSLEKNQNCTRLALARRLGLVVCFDPRFINRLVD
ncbi:hypothetical protein AVEN_112270-1 [Araneus ventricosus]|uniref:Uncharacterized protein n=1 Tax=Araneus ventricosus TaxID=182803 RepID=A0A4Y2WFR2_ARAVE|nr:hypothetical protein AVEN_235109-1 [Araneus ventricosus]GBO35407.1 hypothetical protein AVEN_112270-1 [Araneus ventricosus]